MKIIWSGLAIVGALVILLCLLWWQGWAVTVLWKWFLDDYWPTPSVPTAMGCVLLIRMAWAKTLKPSADYIRDNFVDSLVTTLLAPVVALTLGYVIKYWIMI